MIGTRVQLHPATDRWMMGDRYGVVVKVTTRNAKLGTPCEFFHVKLDKSGKTIKYTGDLIERVS